MQPANPVTRTELAQALADVDAHVAAFFGSLSADEYGARAGTSWSPAQDLEHLNMTVQAVTRGLVAPRWFLRWRFGKAARPSRSYDEIRTAYDAALAQGGKSPAAFVPADPGSSSTGADVQRNRDLERWAKRNRRMRDALDRWSEAALDTLQMPHPLLGRLTAREMILFTLSHNQHHVAGARRRLLGAPGR